MKKNTILLINEGLSDNFGDQAIKESMSFLIKKTGFNVIFQDLTRNKNKYRHQYDIEIDKNKRTFLMPLKSMAWKMLWVVKNLKRITFTSMRKYDAVVIGGGQLLLSNGIFPLALLLWVALLKFRNNKNIVLFSVGMQGEYTGIQRWVFSYILKNIEYVYVRDALSKEILEKVFSKKSELTYDSAFIYDSVYKIRQTKEVYKYLIGIVDYEIYCQYDAKINNTKLSRYDYFKTWVAHANKGNDLDKVALIYATAEDRRECIKFKDYIKEYYNTDIDILENANQKEFLKNLELGEIIVSGRMHSLILSLVLRKKILPYIISEKIQAFLRVVEKNFDIQKAQQTLFDDFDYLMSKTLSINSKNRRR
jgi:polysaccharide pyruvyl transferase WcaK-like protein